MWKVKTIKTTVMLDEAKEIANWLNEIGATQAQVIHGASSYISVLAYVEDSPAPLPQVHTFFQGVKLTHLE